MKDEPLHAVVLDEFRAAGREVKQERRAAEEEKQRKEGRKQQRKEPAGLEKRATASPSLTQPREKAKPNDRLNNKKKRK